MRLAACSTRSLQGSEAPSLLGIKKALEDCSALVERIVIRKRLVERIVIRKKTCRAHCEQGREKWRPILPL